MLANRVIPSVAFKALTVFYQGYVNVPNSTTQTFTPSAPVTSFAVVFVRNLGGIGQSNIALFLTPTAGVSVEVVAMDIGAIYLYISPASSSISIAGASVTDTAGFTSVSLQTGANVATNVEMLLAG